MSLVSLLRRREEDEVFHADFNKLLRGRSSRVYVVGRTEARNALYSGSATSVNSGAYAGAVAQDPAGNSSRV